MKGRVNLPLVEWVRLTIISAFIIGLVILFLFGCFTALSNSIRYMTRVRSVFCIKDEIFK